MSAYERVNVGTDSSGRPVVMNRRMLVMFQLACDHSGVTPTIVQGAYRGSQGAAASAGTHAAGGCLDLRTWDISAAQRDAVMRAARSIGWAAWYRTAAQGFDEHMHWLALGDAEMHPDARAQEVAYRAGRNGLASGAPDDFWRPSPIPTFDYDANAEEPDEMRPEDWNRFNEIVKRHTDGLVTARAFGEFRDNSAQRDAELRKLIEGQVLAEIDALPNNTLTKTEARAVFNKVLGKR